VLKFSTSVVFGLARSKLVTQPTGRFEYITGSMSAPHLQCKFALVGPLPDALAARPYWQCDCGCWPVRLPPCMARSEPYLS